MSTLAPSCAADWIAHLGLAPHPEGGFYRETYRAAARVVVPRAGAPHSTRAAGTAILFLLPGDQVSRLHRLAADELWHFHAGSPLRVHLLEPTGVARTVTLGPDPARDEVFQAVVPAGCWFGAEVAEPDGWSLVGCTVAPGFDFADLELAERDALLAAYPGHRPLVERLTRPDGA